MTPVLCLENLHKSYGALRVTDDVSLEVYPGECHALIGPNGAGKTTLIRQIAGGLKSDSGRILFAGRDITNLSLPQRSAAGLGRTFQITTLIPHFSVLENAALSAQAKSGSSFRFLRPAAHENNLNEKAMLALKSLTSWLAQIVWLENYHTANNGSWNLLWPLWLPPKYYC